MSSKWVIDVGLEKLLIVADRKKQKADKKK
jgi:hypothetical protein